MEENRLLLILCYILSLILVTAAISYWINEEDIKNETVVIVLFIIASFLAILAIVLASRGFSYIASIFFVIALILQVSIAAIGDNSTFACSSATCISVSLFCCACLCEFWTAYDRSSLDSYEP